MTSFDQKTWKVAIIGSDPAKGRIEESLRSGGFDVVFHDALEDFHDSSATVVPDCFLLLDAPPPPAIRALRDEFPLAQLVAVVMAEEAALAMAAMKESGTEVFSQPYDPDDLLAHVRLSAQTSKPRREVMGAADDLRNRFTILSTRENQIMGLVVQGLLSKQIAKALSISVRTVEAHRANILRKTRTRNAIELSQLYAAFQAVVPEQST